MIRRLATIAILSTLLVTPALAQRPKARQDQRQQQQLRKLLKQRTAKRARKIQRKGKRADAQQVQEFQRALDLTDAQAAQVRGIIATRDNELAGLKAGGKGQQKRDAQAIQERFQMNLRALLSPDQARLFDSKRNGRKARIR